MRTFIDLTICTLPPMTKNFLNGVLPLFFEQCPILRKLPQDSGEGVELEGSERIARIPSQKPRTLLNGRPRKIPPPLPTGIVWADGIPLVFTLSSDQKVKVAVMPGFPKQDVKVRLHDRYGDNASLCTQETLEFNNAWRTITFHKDTFVPVVLHQKDASEDAFTTLGRSGQDNELSDGEAGLSDEDDEVGYCWDDLFALANP